jgi:hypothetical protein
VCQADIPTRQPSAVGFFFFTVPRARAAKTPEGSNHKLSRNVGKPLTFKFQWAVDSGTKPVIGFLVLLDKNGDRMVGTHTSYRDGREVVKRLLS